MCEIIKKNNLQFIIDKTGCPDGYWYNVWFLEIYPTWEITTFEVFDKYLDKDKYYIDIGAWIGPTVLYAAQKTKRVIAFEPDNIAFNALKKIL